VEAALDTLFARGDVDYVHVRDTDAGCYDLRVERAASAQAPGAPADVRRSRRADDAVRRRPGRRESGRRSWRPRTSGELVVNGPDGAPPLVVPTHYRYDGGRVLECHLHRDNPVWAALDTSAAGGAPARAVFAVLDADVYIPTQWNAPARTDPQWSAPDELTTRRCRRSAARRSWTTGGVGGAADPADGADAARGRASPGRTGADAFGRMLAGIRGAAAGD
jgi:transcriptional regulator